MNNKKYIFIIAGLLFIIIILYILISFFIDTDSESTDSAQSPSLMPLQITLPPYKKIETAPTLSPNKGQGIDINSTFIKNSQSELKKLSNSLPYQTSVTSSKGLPIEIVIPQTKFEDNTWTLTVYVFGIDYEIAENDPEYNNMQTSFLESAQQVFYWLKEQNIDTEKIIIQWGDRAFIQERSEAWLLGK